MVRIADEQGGKKMVSCVTHAGCLKNNDTP